MDGQQVAGPAAKYKYFLGTPSRHVSSAALCIVMTWVAKLLFSMQCTDDESWTFTVESVISRALDNIFARMAIF